MAQQEQFNPYGAPEVRPSAPSNVRSAPLFNGKPVATPYRRSGDWTLGVTLIFFGLMGWLTGSRHTLFGWVQGLNLFFASIGVTVIIPTPVGWWILLMIPIGLVYSRVEAEIWKAGQRRGQALALFVIGWLLIVVTDVGTTYLGVRTPPAEDAWPITHTIAASAGIAFVWAAVLTFASDWLIIGGWKLLRR